jgi:LysR family transcriptional regulator, nod-box dependent transcriptional activator
MDFHGLDLNLLVALDVLLEEKNITRTGERIHVCQSATSGILAKLRDFFSDELLVQIGHRMVLTPLAEELILPVRELLQQAQLLLDRSQEFVPADSHRRFRIMLSDYVETVLASSVFRRMETEAPHVCIELLSLSLTDAAGEILERGEVDFLIAPESEISGTHPSETLFDDKYVCALWSENPFVGQEITIDQYLSLGHVGISFGKKRYHSWDEGLLKQRGYNRRVEIVASSFSVMANYLIGTSRIATMHRRLANYYSHILPLRIVDLPFEAIRLVEKLQWHQYLDRSPSHLWLRNIFQEEADRMTDKPWDIEDARLKNTRSVSHYPEYAGVQ